MTNARQGWNAAQLASERKTRKKVVHGPVGSDPLELPETKAGLVDWKGCRGCGYHVCSCAQVPATAKQVTVENGLLTSSCSAPNCCCDKCWSELKPTPALLTVAQAEQAIRAGKTVRLHSSPSDPSGMWKSVLIRWGETVQCPIHNMCGSWSPTKFVENGSVFEIVK